MADRPISGLTQATSMTNADLFAISQGGQAKKVTWETFYSYLAEALDGHGGISSITYTPPPSGSRTGTMTINYADGSSPTTVEVTDGKEITAITQYFAVSTSASIVPDVWYTTRQTLTDTDRYLWSYFEFTFNDPQSEPIETPKTVIGVYGDKGDQGDAGETGNGITSVDYVGTVDMVDTYRITFDNGTTTTFTVTNGSSIQSIDYDSSSGLTDTYIVTLTTGETSSFQVTNGKSITAIVPVDVTHAAGHTDVYRIDFNDGDTFTFSIYNGTNGTGAVSRVDGIDADGTQDVPLLLLGQGAPTPTTVGLLKQRYFDQTNNVLYICTGIDTSGPDTTYIWQGAGVTVDSAFSSTSTNPVRNSVITNKVGTASLNTTAQDLSGAINEHESDISNKVDKVAGKGLSTNDFTNAYKNKIGTATLNTTATDLCGAINEHETDLGNKVDKVSGKGLSTNDFTTAYKNKIGTAALNTSATNLCDAINEHETDIDGKVSKTGDTINGGTLFIRNSGGSSAHQGRIVINNPNITFDESHTETVLGELMFDDAATNLFKASVYGNYTAANTCQIVMRARNWHNGEAVLNTLTLSAMANGGQGVDITAPDAWRKALGLGNSSGAFPITAAQGGTGYTSLQATRNAMGLGNTTGALPVANGGSGQTATTTTTTISDIVTAASGCSVTFAEYVHWGKIAQVRIGIKKTAAVTSGNTTLGTIVSGKRPAIYSLVQTGSAEKNKKGSIAPNGTITVNGAITANEEIQILSTYILA